MALVTSGLLASMLYICIVVLIFNQISLGFQPKHTYRHQNYYKTICIPQKDPIKSVMYSSSQQFNDNNDYNDIPTASSSSDEVQVRDEDFEQNRDLDLILSERAKRFYVNDGQTKQGSKAKEKCILLSINSKITSSKSTINASTEASFFSFEESLNELSELVGTAGLQVAGTCFQKLNIPNPNSYINVGKAYDLMSVVNATKADIVVVDVSTDVLFVYEQKLMLFQ